MAVPVIDPESSVLSYPQWVTWEHQFSGTGSPYTWSIASGNFPTGMIFQPSRAVTGVASTDIINCADHGFANGTVLRFSLITGGTGLNTTTIYYVVNAGTDTFQLSLTPSGAPVNFTTDVAAGTVLRPGYVSGAGTVPGVTTVRLIAINGDGNSAEVLFTIGIEPAAPAPDGNIDLVWNLITGAISVQSTSVVTPSTAAPDAPLITVKFGDDWFARLRFLKGTTWVEMDTLVEDSNLRLIVKELEPDQPVEASEEFTQIGTGGLAAYLIYAKWDDNLLKSALGNYEGDGGTFFDFLAEFEIVCANPESIGPALRTLTSRTFKLRIERDLGANLV